MANTIQHKRSSTASDVPTAGQLSAGELAVNTADGKLFTKKDSGAVIEIGGGGSLPSFTADGGLTIGDTAIVNSDGTVSAVGLESFTVGDLVDIGSTSANQYSIVYDPSSHKVIAIWKEGGGGDIYGAVGTLSGSTTTWGTPLAIATTLCSYPTASWDIAEGKLLVAYTKSASGKVRVCTISGTTLSVGSEQTVGGHTHGYNRMVYSPDDDKHVLIFNTSSQSRAIVLTLTGSTVTAGSVSVPSSNDEQNCSLDYISSSRFLYTYPVGTSLYCKILTISGTSLTMSSATQAVGMRSGTKVSATGYGANSVVLGCRSTDIKGAVIAATLSVNVATWGSVVEYDVGSSNLEVGGMQWDEYNSEFILFCKRNSAYHAKITGTLSGNTVSLGTLVTVGTTTNPQTPSVVYSSYSKVFVIANPDDNSTLDMEARLYNTGAAVSNLNSDNYVGIAQSTVTDGNSVEIATDGNIDANQAALTPGIIYHIDYDGSLSTTTDTEVVAGLALSSTEINVSTSAVPTLSTVATQSEMENGTESNLRLMSPLRIHQAIDGKVIYPYYIRGLVPSIIASNEASISVGSCIASSSTSRLDLTSSLDKLIDATWVEGDGNGGNFDGVIHSNNTVHFFLIEKDADGSIDAGYDSSITCANIPTGYTKYRRVGSFSTGTSVTLGAIFIEDHARDVTEIAGGGVRIIYDDPPIDLDSTSHGTSSVTINVSIPGNIRGEAILSGMTTLSAAYNVYFRELQMTDITPVGESSHLKCTTTAQHMNAEFTLLTDNTATAKYGQIKYRTTNGSATIKLATRGYIDHRRD